MIDNRTIRDVIEENLMPEEKWYDVDYEDKSLQRMLYDRKLVDREEFIEHIYWAFKDDKVVYLDKEWHRRMGKTNIIKELAKEYKLVIVANTNYQKRELNKEGYFALTVEELRGGTLVDENRNVLVDLVGKESECIITQLKQMGLKPVGFVQNSKNPYYNIR